MTRVAELWPEEGARARYYSLRQASDSVREVWRGPIVGFERLQCFYWSHRELVDEEVELVKGSALLQFLTYLDLRPCCLCCE